MFPDELDPCPTALDYTAFYEAEHGDLAVVRRTDMSTDSQPRSVDKQADTTRQHKTCYDVIRQDMIRRDMT